MRFALPFPLDSRATGSSNDFLPSLDAPFWLLRTARRKQNRLASKLLTPTTLSPAAMRVAAAVLFITHRRLPISPKPWNVRILKLNDLVKRYSQIKWIFSIEVVKVSR
jgi:hypothetical protein